MLENVSIILVEPAGDENIGMAARALKNCGITDLRLINPPNFKTRGARKWACNALDVLKDARVFKTLGSAIEDISLVVGLSRREGSQRPPLLEHSKAASIILKRAKKGRVALVFGREADGLAKSEIACCDLIWTIPTSDGYPSLNLAQAVLLAVHELFFKDNGKRQKSDTAAGSRNLVSKGETKPVLRELMRTLTILGYDDRENGKLRKKIMNEFERLFGRGGLFRKDLNMFLGLCARIQERVK